MAIDAVIQYVSQKENEIVLVLAPRWDARNKSWSIPGQDKLRIDMPTRIPKEGQAVWGGDSTIRIVQDDKSEWLYGRVSSGHLKEIL